MKKISASLLLMSLSSLASAAELNYLPYLEAGSAKTFNEHSRWTGNLDAFIPLYQKGLKHLVFTHLRAFDRTGKPFEGNVHLGYRYLSDDNKWLLGGYFAYDHLRGRYNPSLNQLTFGVEGWYKQLFANFNLYIPVGKKDHGYNTLRYRVSGEKIQFTGSDVREIAMHGFDGTIGCEFIRGLTLYMGGCYFHAPHVETICGPQAKIKYDFTLAGRRILGIFDKLGFEAGVRNDYRKTSGYLGLNFRVGFANHTKALPGVASHMADLILRDRDIVSHVDRYQPKALSLGLTEIDNKILIKDNGTICYQNRDFVPEDAANWQNLLDSTANSTSETKSKSTEPNKQPSCQPSQWPNWLDPLLQADNQPNRQKPVKAKAEQPISQQLHLYGVLTWPIVRNHSNLCLPTDLVTKKAHNTLKDLTSTVSYTNSSIPQVCLKSGEENYLAGEYHYDKPAPIEADETKKEGQPKFQQLYSNGLLTWLVIENSLCVLTDKPTKLVNPNNQKESKTFPLARIYSHKSLYREPPKNQVQTYQPESTPEQYPTCSNNITISRNQPSPPPTDFYVDEGIRCSFTGGQISVETGKCTEGLADEQVNPSNFTESTKNYPLYFNVTIIKTGTSDLHQIAANNSTLNSLTHKQDAAEPDISTTDKLPSGVNLTSSPQDDVCPAATNPPNGVCPVANDTLKNISSTTSNSPSSVNEPLLSEYQRKIDDLQNQVDSWEKKASSLSSTNEELKNQITQFEEKIQSLKNQFQTLSKSKEDEIADLKKQIEELQQDDKYIPEHLQIAMYEEQIGELRDQIDHLKGSQTSSEQTTQKQNNWLNSDLIITARIAACMLVAIHELMKPDNIQWLRNQLRHRFDVL